MALKITRQIPTVPEPSISPIHISEYTPTEEKLSDTEDKITEISTDESEETTENEQVTNEITDNEKIDSIESHIIEKVDTSHVEKLVKIVSSVRTLIARGMIHEAQTLIVE